MADRYTSKEFRDLQGNTERFIWDNKTNKRVSKERFQESLRIPASLYTRERIGGRNVLVSKATGKVVEQEEVNQLIDYNRQIRRAAQSKLRGDAYSSINRNIIKPVGIALSDFMKIGVWAEGGTGKETVLGRKSRLAKEEKESNLEDDRKEFKPNAEQLKLQQSRINSTSIANSQPSTSSVQPPTDSSVDKEDVTNKNTNLQEQKGTNLQSNTAGSLTYWDSTTDKTVQVDPSSTTPFATGEKNAQTLKINQDKAKAQKFLDNYRGQRITPDVMKALNIVDGGAKGTYQTRLTRNQFRKGAPGIIKGTGFDYP